MDKHTNTAAEVYPDPETIERRRRLFDKYITPNLNLVFSVCLKYSYDKREVEDDYIDVLNNFYSYIDTYDPTKSLNTWIYICTRRYIQERNRKRSRIERPDHILIEEVGTNDPALGYVSENLLGLDNYHQYYNDDILRALARLKPIYREALLLQQAGYKLTEIVEITYRNGTLRSRNIETVKSRLFLAKQQLRKVLTKDGEERKG